jgi:hypothetical protein
MASSSKTKRAAQAETAVDEDAVRQTAYLLWEQATGGSPVDEEQSRRFWLEAEQQLTSNGSNGHS